MGVPEPTPVYALRRRPSRLRAVLVSLRPRQWTKNLLLFAGIIFAAKLGDLGRWGEALAAFAAYCAASSASYLVNDVRDAPHDRLHPSKRLRPIAHGDLSPRLAEALAAALLIAAVLLIAPLGLASILFLCTFLALQAAYTLSLKHVVLLDVMTIAGLFVVRAAAGAAAVEVRISPWLLLCTALLALFLALAKRRGELVLVGAEATPGRPVLEGYSLALVDQLVTVVAASTVISYCLYTFTARGSKAMMITIPFVLFGVFRYLLLMHARDLGEEPEEVLLRDAPILLCIAGWAVTAAIILSVT
ncbi:MAG TPA: decaprenyl-phosphate phosphoribosyltransferase [Gaiellaceae bacterium]|jgi:4-hydroxybenzoate polyprenyltransferase|nr:decaprenyl-phosphate phosphoribosyltransferase [Gaiellaceae bacterium]